MRIRLKEVNGGSGYLSVYGMAFAAKRRIDAELNHRSMGVKKCADVLKNVWNNINISMESCML